MQNRNIKVVLIGNLNDKTKFTADILRNDHESSSNYSTIIGVDFKLVVHNNEKFQIWDTVGAERFISIAAMTLKNADALIFINPSKAQRESVTKELSNNQNIIVLEHDTSKHPLEYLSEIQSKLNKPAQHTFTDTKLNKPVQKKITYKREEQDNVTSAVAFHNNL